MYFISNCINLHYVDKGNGRPLIMLHGLTSNSEMFKIEIEIYRKIIV